MFIQLDESVEGCPNVMTEGELVGFLLNSARRVGFGTNEGIGDSASWRANSATQVDWKLTLTRMLTLARGKRVILP